MSVCANAFAKINLTLDLAGRRGDGYHLLRMVMQTVSLCDRLILEPLSVQEIRVSCGDTELDFGGGNTVARAAAAFFSAAGIRAGASFFIEKNIPSQAGLGGGSADAAAALVLLNRAFHAGLSMDRLCEIGLSVGADVPFCLRGGTLLAEGIGEKLSELPPLPECGIVICKPQAGSNTAQAYALLDQTDGKPTYFTDKLIPFLNQKSLPGIAGTCGNAFEPIILIPEVRQIKSEMLQSGALGACMTGSGSAVYGIFSDPRKAEDCASALSRRFQDVFLCRPVRRKDCFLLEK
jgi:4-diphosphocytidyl-2-C-methyl-D-erythritol kinase